MSPRDWELDKDWADGYGPQVAQILKANVGAIVAVDTASHEQDTRQATDLVVRVPAGQVALRLRRDNIKYRDLTLRYRRRWGGEWHADYEVSKILAGFARWYFYAWTKREDIGDWVLVDLDPVRAAGLIEDAVDANREKPNTDGRTTFIWITLDELHGVNAIVAESVLQSVRCSCARCGRPAYAVASQVKDTSICLQCCREGMAA